MHDDKAPLRRFLLACLNLVRTWQWLLGAAILAALVGVAPSVFVIIAILGVVWVPILVLVFWGRLLDEMVPSRRDKSDGPW
ncbi:MAG: hypothetical protein AAFS07_00430 [Pseudomonadota bacterium]